MPGGISYIGDLTIVESGGEITSQSVGDKSLMSTAADSTSIEVSSSTGKLGLVARGSSLSNGAQRDQVSKFAGTWLQGSLVASDAAGGIISLQNSFGTNLIVTRMVIYLTATNGETMTIDVGIGSGASTSYNTLIDGLNVNSETGAFDNIKDKGDSGEEIHLWTSAHYITASKATGSAASIAGKYAVHVIDINS